MGVMSTMIQSFLNLIEDHFNLYGSNKTSVLHVLALSQTLAKGTAHPNLAFSETLNLRQHQKLDLRSETSTNQKAAIRPRRSQ